jgi:mRNA-degrading endonuclease RelE of RelBE toxin-antitoxin system
MTTPFKEIVRLPDFERDMKKLLKRFRSLEEDLDNFIKTELALFHKLRIDNKGVVQMAGLGIQGPRIYKARKFACRALKGKGAHSGIRVIYAYIEQNDKIELIEIYYKGDKENEHRERILAKYG